MSQENTQQLEPTSWADATGKGLIAGLDEFFDGPAKGDITPSININEPAKSTLETPAEPVKAATTPKAEPEPAKAEEPIAPIIEEEFFKGDEEPVKEEPKAESFDETAFDAQTAAILAELEKKGHPGDVYKELRTELKTLKQATPVADPIKEKEVADLRLKADEAEGLRARLQEVTGQSAKLQVENSDEYAADVLTPLRSLYAGLDALSATYELDPSILRAFVREGDRKVQDQFVADNLTALSDFSKTEVYSAALKFNELLNKRDAMMENADQKIAAQEAKKIESDNRLLAEQRQSVQTIQKDIWNKYKGKPGFEDEAVVEALSKKGLAIDFSTAKGRDQAFAAFAGVALPHVVQQLALAQRKLAQYEKSDEKAVKGSPAPGGSIKPTPTGEAAPAGFMAGFLTADLA